MGKVVPLTTQTAKITTAAVEINTLTVSGKQVTLAVFRQLIEEDLISYAGTLKGLPWGTVNYHPGTCAYQGYELRRPHWHVVWQNGSDLRRATVPVDIDFDLFGSDWGDLYARAVHRDVLLDEIAIGDCPWKVTHRGSQPLVEGTAEGVRFVFSAPGDDIANLGKSLRSIEYHKNEKQKYEPIHKTAPKSEPLPFRPGMLGRNLANLMGTENDNYNQQQISWHDEKISEAQREVEKACAGLIGDREETQKEWLAEIREEKARRDQWRKTLKEIASLPQLFIAV